jgi:hypothetical protein
VARGSGRGPGFVARVESEGLLHPGRGVTVKVRDSGDGRSALRRESTNGRTRESGRELRCYACGNLGHVARACTGVGSNGWRRSASQNGSRARDCSHVGTRQ